jgi:hypothetical protein
VRALPAHNDLRVKRTIRAGEFGGTLSDPIFQVIASSSQGFSLFFQQHALRDGAAPPAIRSSGAPSVRVRPVGKLHREHRVGLTNSRPMRTFVQARWSVTRHGSRH